MPLTRDGLLARATWKDENQLEFTLPVPVFGGDMKCFVWTREPGRVSDRTVHTFAQLQVLDAGQLERIKAVVWDNCVLCCETTGYGVDVAEGESEAQANHREFGALDAEGAWARTRLEELQVFEDDQDEYAANYARIALDNEWESHGVRVVVRDGVVVGGGEDGLFIGRFEPDYRPKARGTGG